jgi:hypothetical protein
MSSINNQPVKSRLQIRDSGRECSALTSPTTMSAMLVQISSSFSSTSPVCQRTLLAPYISSKIDSL